MKLVIYQSVFIRYTHEALQLLLCKGAGFSLSKDYANVVSIIVHFTTLNYNLQKEAVLPKTNKA